MALNTEVLEQTPSQQLVREWDDVTGWESRRWEPKPANPEYDERALNEQKIRTQADRAIERMTQIANTTFTTAAQRDQAIKDEARAIRALIRLAVGRVESAD